MSAAILVESAIGRMPTVSPAGIHPLSFSGRSSITVPVGAVAISDPVDMQIPSASDLTISIFLPFQVIQLRILEYRPPRTAEILVIRLGGLPVPYFFIGRRSLYRRRVVLWANHASSQLERCDRYQNPPGRFP